MRNIDAPVTCTTLASQHVTVRRAPHIVALLHRLGLMPSQAPSAPCGGLQLSSVGRRTTQARLPNGKFAGAAWVRAAETITNADRAWFCRPVGA